MEFQIGRKELCSVPFQWSYCHTLQKQLLVSDKPRTNHNGSEVCLDSYLCLSFIVKTLLKTRLTPSGKTEAKAELPQVTESCGEMEDALTVVLNYVEDVLADRITADNTIGRNLLKLVQVVPKMNPDELDNMLNANIKVSYFLANTTRLLNC